MRLTTPRRPTSQEIQAAVDKTLPDVIAPKLKVLLCGINPGLYSAAIGHNFGRPGNRFWPTMYAAGITPHLLSPYEELELLNYGYGITNLVSRATAAADELTRTELVEGRVILEAKVRLYTPRILAFLGITAYRAAYQRSHVQIGPQPEKLGDTRVWVLPNPSGLNAHYDLTALARLFRELKDAE